MADESKGAVKFELECSEEELSNILIKNLALNGIYPIEVEIDSDHALPLELGTKGPYKGMPPWGPGSKLHQWVDFRFPVHTRPERTRIAFNLARKFKEEGTKPHAFIRPALEQLKSVGLETYINRGYGMSMLDVGEIMISMMRMHLERNDSIFKWEVYDNMRVRKLTGADSWLITHGKSLDRGSFDIDSVIASLREASR